MRVLRHTLPVLLSIAEVAAYLRQQPRTITSWIRAGDLPGVKIGRQWFIIEDDLRDYLRARSDALLARAAIVRYT
jgi:excisionase family DNA binding protein